MDTRPPEHSEGNPNIVLLGKEFGLFDSLFKKYNSPFRDAGYKSKFLLRTEFLPEIELTPDAFNYDKTDSSEEDSTTPITPFDPESGYIIDEQDFNSQEREKKTIQESGAIESSPLWLTIRSEDYSLNAEHLDLVRRLRLQLFFPNNLSFESNPSEDFIRDALAIHFNSFYPLDTGPLAPLPYIGNLSINLPDDPLKLQQIRAKILMVPEQRK
ncbi:MAG TPA: hypothetical protein VKC89_00760 [Patescibacteria group bacterium]|nr:hypothetical protein [Patescibacteria group bacterium]